MEPEKDKDHGSSLTPCEQHTPQAGKKKRKKKETRWLSNFAALF